MVNVVLLGPLLSFGKRLKIIMDLLAMIKVVHMVVLKSPHHYLVHIVARHRGHTELDCIEIISDVLWKLLCGARVVATSLQAAAPLY